MNMKNEKPIVAIAAIAATTAIATVAKIGSPRFADAMSYSATAQENMLRRAGNAACRMRDESSAKRCALMKRKASRYLAYKIVPVVERDGLYFFEQEEICKLTGEQRARSLVVRKNEPHKRDELVWDVVQRGALYYILAGAERVNYKVAFSWRDDANGNSHLMGLQILAPLEPQSNSGR